MRHHRGDGPGLLGGAFEEAGFSLQLHDGGKAGALPDPLRADAVVLLGSTWSVYDRSAVGSWIDAELDWLRELHRTGTPVLGVCFGAQALAAAHGGGVERASRKELGWVELEETTVPSVERGPWFEWHGDRCVLPPGSRLMARNEVAAQAFSLGRHMGVQFHPEVDRAQLASWIDQGGRRELVAGGIDPEQLLEETERQEELATGRAGRLVQGFLDRAAASRQPQRPPGPAAPGAAPGSPLLRPHHC